MIMKISINILSALALAITLSPLAAQAHAASQPAPQYTQPTNDHIDQIMVGSSTIDMPTHVYSNDVFPNSFGG
jgi:hypothetical protein